MAQVDAVEESEKPAETEAPETPPPSGDGQAQSDGTPET
jgi:hypothetical protein